MAPMFSKPDHDMTLSETARLLDVPEQAVLRWARKGALPCRTVRGEPHFGRRDVEQWARQMGMKLRGGGDSETKSEPNALAMSIRRGGLVPNVQGDSVDSVLQDLVFRIELPGRLTRDELVELLLARERLASTGAGDGIAIPHSRHPLTDHVHEPRVIVGRLAHPVDWQAIDQQPVHLLLLVLSCSLKGHLDMLARIALAMRTPELRRALEEETDVERLCRTIEAYPG